MASVTVPPSGTETSSSDSKPEKSRWEKEKAWWEKKKEKYWEGKDNKIPWPKLLWLGFLAGVLSYLVLRFGGSALESYLGLQATNDAAPRHGAVAIGALTLAWRLINRNYGQARWGTALALIAVLLFGTLVWPTPWTYERFGCEVFQIRRFSGDRDKVTTIPFCEQAVASPATAGN